MSGAFRGDQRPVCCGEQTHTIVHCIDLLIPALFLAITGIFPVFYPAKWIFERILTRLDQHEHFGTTYEALYP